MRGMRLGRFYCIRACLNALLQRCTATGLLNSVLLLAGGHVSMWGIPMSLLEFLENLDNRMNLALTVLGMQLRVGEACAV